MKKVILLTYSFIFIFTAGCASIQEPNPAEGVIIIGAPGNWHTFPNMPHLSAVVDENDLNTIIGNMLDADPVSKCPKIWSQTVPYQSIPTYSIFISASQGDGFLMTIHPTIPEMEPYGILGIGLIPEESNGNIMMILEYQPSDSQLPEELEIQVVFSGCEIYKALVSWP